MNDLDVKKIRLDLGVSQEKLAEMLGVSLRTVQRWEQGECISFKNVAQLHKICHNSSQQKSEETAEQTQEIVSESKEIILKSKEKEIELLEKRIADKEKQIELLEQQVADKNEIISLLKQKTYTEVGIITGLHNNNKTMAKDSNQKIK